MKSEKSFLAADGTRIAYSTTGRGPAMILCDGIGCNGFAWKYFAPYFQDNYRVIRWHYRGHGNSSTPSDTNRLRMEDIRDDLHRLFRAEAVESAVLVGHSMGVQVILDYAAHHPAQVNALVPICGSYRRPLTTFHDSPVADKIFPYLRASAMRFPRIAKQVWKFVATSPLSYPVAATFEVNADFLARADFQPYFDHLAQMDVNVFLGMLADLNAHDLTNELPSLKAPTLIVAGERDTFTPGWLSLEMNHQIAASELLMIPGGTHTAPLEFPELINLRVEKFLRERVPLKIAA